MKDHTLHMIKAAATALLIACMVSAPSHAQHNRPKGPPPEAKEACVDKGEGDEVTFKTRRGDSIKAHCQLVESELVAVPDDHEHQNQPSDS